MSYEYESDDIVLLTIDNVLQRVSQEDIIQLVTKYKPELYRYVTSPFRDDSDAGAWFNYYNGKLFFVDFGDSHRQHRDCFNMIEDAFGLSLTDSLKLINDHFKLGLGSSNAVESTLPSIAEIKSKRKERSEKEETVITFKTRYFTLADQAYWQGKYGISKANLIEDNIFPIIWFKFWSTKKKKMIIIRPFSEAYAFTDFDNERVKIYTPYASNKKLKWITNCKQDDIGGKVADTGETLVITKSYKDYRVLKNQGLHVLWFQNEGIVPNIDILTDLCNRFENIVFWYDNDPTGILNSIKLANIVNEIVPEKATAIHLPTSYLKDRIKDPSDLVCMKGLNTLQAFLKEKQLL